MVVTDLHVGGIAIAPREAYPPLIVDTDAVLTGAIADEPLKAVPRRNAEISKTPGRVEDEQLSVSALLYVSRQPPRSLPVEDPPRLSIAKALDHLARLPPGHSNVKRYY